MIVERVVSQYTSAGQVGHGKVGGGVRGRVGGGGGVSQVALHCI